MTLRAPFPYFGGKSKVATPVWDRLGDVKNYVEPFAGSLAVLLARPHEPGVETINDLNHFVANFWRAVKLAPEEVSAFADWPLNEADLHARHHWLITEGEQRVARIIGEPGGYDPQVAGWWLWGICAWIGGGWCSGDGPWRWVGGAWQSRIGRQRLGISRQLPYLSGAGMGINRQLPHLGHGRGINRRIKGSARRRRRLYIRLWMNALCRRLRDVRVCCGDWDRVCGPSPTARLGLTGVFLDPPYGIADRSDVYATESRSASADARRWAISVGDDPRMRIAFCSYAGEFDDPWPPGWEEFAWKAHGGYGSQGRGRGRANAERERIWFSPHCLPAAPDPTRVAEAES